MWESFIAFYGTKDIEETHKFYVGALGLSLYQDQRTCRIYEVTQGGLIGFCEHLDVAISGANTWMLPYPGEALYSRWLPTK